MAGPSLLNKSSNIKFQTNPYNYLIHICKIICYGHNYMFTFHLDDTYRKWWVSALPTPAFICCTVLASLLLPHTIRHIHPSSGVYSVHSWVIMLERSGDLCLATYVQRSLGPVPRANNQAQLMNKILFLKKKLKVSQLSRKVMTLFTFLPRQGANTT